RMLQDSLDPDVAARVTMTGFLLHDEVVEHYRAADLLVCPSIWEEQFAALPCRGPPGRPVVLGRAVRRSPAGGHGGGSARCRVGQGRLCRMRRAWNYRRAPLAGGQH